MKNRILTIILAAAMTITGFAMPMTAYGAEGQAEDTVQTVETTEAETEATEETEQTEETAPAEETAVEEETAAEEETELQEEPAAEEVVTITVEDLEPAAEPAEEESLLLASASTNKTESKIATTKVLIKTPTLKGKLASNKLSAKLSWTKVPGAAGYKVYKYNAKTKKYKVIKTIKSGSTLTYKVKPTAGVKNYYKVRAYRNSDGSKVYSKYSKSVTFNLVGETATTLEFKAGTTNLSSAKRTGKTSGALTWKKVSGASGYSVYKYNASKGEYVWLKNIKGASTLKTSVKLSASKSTTFKVRAYKDYKGRRIRNGFSSSKKVEGLTKGERIVSTGKSKLGCPYVYGACGPNCFDCSGFVMWVMKQNGYYLPHNAASQYYALSSKNIGTNWRNAKAGDIVFYSYGGPGSSHHVGIYVGGGKVMHASSSHGRVVITRVTYTNGHIAAICRP